VSVSEFCQEFGDFEMNKDFPDRGIEFLSSHFHEIDSSFLNGFPISIVVRILSNSSLQISSEDSLYKMIRCKIESNSSFIELFSFIRFEFLSVDSIEDFISWSCEYFEYFERFHSLDVWIAICRRLCLSVEVKSPNARYCDKSLHFVPQSDSPLCGIISYLTSQHGGNVCDRGIVNVSGSTIYGSRVAENAVDLLSISYFMSQNQPNQWLCYDFNNRKVRPTHYSIRVYPGSSDLRSWVFEGSMDGSTWTELDRRTNDQTTNSSHQIGTFSISTNLECKFVRFRQTDVNAGRTHSLILYAMEIFGDLIE
jgi:hypothetical protein